MLDAVEFSVFSNPGQDTQHLEKLIRRFLPGAHLTTLNWEKSYLELSDFAMHKIGPDVSMVTNGVVPDMTAMNALRPFSAEDVAFIGGAESFIPNLRETYLTPTDRPVYAIPWIADPRLIYYWRDMLENVGINEESAFESPAQFEVTLQQLQAAGMQTPLVQASGSPSLTFHIAAGWVWRAGGDFISASCTESMLTHPCTLNGLATFYRLYRYMPENSPELDAERAAAFFSSRRAAVTILDVCHGNDIIKNLPPDLQPNLGISMTPGPSYLGGSCLVIWMRSYREERARELIRYLVSPEVQGEHCLHTGYLPTRLDTLSMPEFYTNPYFATYRKAIEVNCTFPNIQASGLVQNTIKGALASIWQDIFRSKDKDIDAILKKRLAPVDRRVQWILNQ